MDTTISKKGKIVILVALLILAAPLYLTSTSGIYRVAGIQTNSDGGVTGFAPADDAKTPDRILTAARFLNNTYREPEAEAVLEQWLDHYGGDETEKDPQQRFITWRAYPYSDEKPRPPMHGEDYRKEPHPSTAQALILYGERMERLHYYQNSKHIYDIILSEGFPFYKDTDARTRAQKGVDRNGSGRNNF